MNFFIRKNSTLPVLKVQLYKDTRNNFREFANDLTGATITFSMADEITGTQVIVDQPAYLEENVGYPGEYFIVYQFSKKETKRTGGYIGQFKVKNQYGEIIVPVREILQINITDSFATNDACCKVNGGFVPTPKPSETPDPAKITATPTPTPTNTPTPSITTTTTQTLTPSPSVVYYYYNFRYSVLSFNEACGNPVDVNTYFSTSAPPLSLGEFIYVQTESGYEIASQGYYITEDYSIGYNIGGSSQDIIQVDVNPCYIEPSQTPTQTYTQTVTPTQTNTPTESPTETPTGTPGNSPTPTPTITETPTETPTPTITPTNTVTPSFTPTLTPSPTQAVVPSDPTLEIYYQGSLATFFTPTPTSGSTFTQWVDSSSSAHNANPIGGGPTPAPEWWSNVQNGLGAVYFNGTTDGLSVNPLTDLQNNSGQTIVIVAKSLNSSATGQYIQGGEDQNTGLNSVFLRQSGGTYNVAEAGGFAAVNGTPVDTNPHILTIVFSGTGLTDSDRLKFRIDSVEQSMAYLSPVGTTTSSLTTYAFMGVSYTPVTAGTEQYFYNGFLMDVLVYSRALTSFELDSIEIYLSNKWNIPLL